METNKPRLAEDITIDDLRKIKKYENLTDEEANEILLGLEKLALIMFNIWKKEKRLQNESKHFQTIRKRAA